MGGQKEALRNRCQFFSHHCVPPDCPLALSVSSLFLSAVLSAHRFGAHSYTFTILLLFRLGPGVFVPAPERLRNRHHDDDQENEEEKGEGGRGKQGKKGWKKGRAGPTTFNMQIALVISRPRSMGRLRISRGFLVHDSIARN